MTDAIPTAKDPAACAASANLVHSIDLYKHHFSLFLQGIAVYLGIVSACVLVAYGKDTVGSANLLRQPALILGLLASVMEAYACSRVIEWGASFQQAFTALSKEAGYSFVPPVAAVTIARTCIVGGLAIAVLLGALLLLERF